MNSKKQLMVFVMGAAVLLTLATSLIVAAHYWEMLSGIWLIAIVGLLLPDWVSLWGSKWYAAEDEDRRVKVTALVVAFVMAVTMTLNAGAVLAVKYEDGKLKEVAERKDKAAQATEQTKQTGNVDAINARAQQVQRMKAAGMSERTIRQFLKDEADRDKAKSLSGDGVAITEANREAIEFKPLVPEPIRKYMAFWVYIVPFLIGLFGKFALGAAIALPGGAEFGQPTKKHPAGFAQPAATAARTEKDPKGKADWI